MSSIHLVRLLELLHHTNEISCELEITDFPSFFRSRKKVLRPRPASYRVGAVTDCEITTYPVSVVFEK